MIWNHIFRYTQLNDQAVLFLTILFGINQQNYIVPSIGKYHKQFDLNSHLFTHCLTIKQFYF